jgi:hypothetical protein
MGQRGLIDIGISFDLFEQGQFAKIVVCSFHNFKIQSLNYNPNQGRVKRKIIPPQAWVKRIQEK